MSVASKCTASYTPGDLLRNRGNANDDRQYILAPLRLRPYNVGGWFCSSSLQAVTSINIVPNTVHLETTVLALHTCYNNSLLNYYFMFDTIVLIFF